MYSPIKVLGLVMALSAVCLCAPTGDDNGVKAVVDSLIKTAQPRPVVDAAQAEEYKQLQACYNGTFTRLMLHDLNTNADISEEPLYKFCYANRHRLVDSLWFNVEKYGAELYMPVYFLGYFEKFVVDEGLQSKSVKDQLMEYRTRWNFRVEGIDSKMYCKNMVHLFDEELAQWDLEQPHVIENLETKTKQPIGRALEVCHVVVSL